MELVNGKKSSGDTPKKKKLGALSGVHPNAILRIETGEIKKPRDRTMAKIMEALNRKQSKESDLADAIRELAEAIRMLAKK